MFTYIRPENCNVQIFNDRKPPAKGFDPFIVKILKTHNIIPLWLSYYIPQSPQNTISQTAIKHYNQLGRVKNEALRWLLITTDTSKKLKFETTVKERDQKLPDFITIYGLNIEKHHY